MSSDVDIVVVGTSSGGLAAIGRLLGPLPASFEVPIVIVQHRGRESTDALVEVLQRTTALRVREAEDKEPIAPGVFIAPPDYHLMVEPECFALSVDEYVAYSRPSIDVLFESAADSFGAGVVGVLLTGANQDGTRGLERIKRAGGRVLVQDPHTAESPTMPASAVANVDVDRVLGVEEIARALMGLTGHRGAQEVGAWR